MWFYPPSKQIPEEPFFKVENASNELIACMHGDSSSIFGGTPEKDFRSFPKIVIAVRLTCFNVKHVRR
jgi:hypothetical protein